MFGRAPSNRELRKRIEKLELDLADLDERYQSLLGQHKKLYSRIHMREVRKLRKDSDEQPDEFTVADANAPNIDPVRREDLNRMLAAKLQR